LGPIPRLEDVRKMIHDQTLPYGQQDRHEYQATGYYLGAEPEANTPGAKTTVATGAQMLRIAVDLEALEASGIHRRVALGVLERRKGAYDPYLLGALLKTAEPETSDPDVLQLLASELEPGMTVVRDVTDSAGRLLVGRGYQVTESLIERIRNWRTTTLVSEPIYVSSGSVPGSSLPGSSVPVPTVPGDDEESSQVF
jgi:hypothetical protein